MKIFEDLIDELKEENLLEETVIKAGKVKNDSKPPSTEADNADMVSAFQTEAVAASNLSESTKESAPERPPVIEEDIKNTSQNNPQIFEAEPKTASQPSNEAEYYRKRAMEEVAFLQMVEHVFAGVEREQMKIAPKPYDHLEVKKVLHSFLQVSGDVKSPEHAQLEFRLMQETESWYSALSHRDKRISVAHLRRYCEMTRPTLSSPALIALARFYRNAPFSEQIRNKFDLVLTKLFTKDSGGEKRNMVLSREELIKHLNELYADWSSIPLYLTNDEDDSEVLLMALKFEDFMAETEAAENFDELVRNDFFNRVRSFKESTCEQFFAPLVTAAAIESNVRIGNRYVELLNREREKGESAKLEDKYGFLHDQIISDATSKTLQLAELLKERIERSESAAENKGALNKETSQSKTEPKSEAAVKSGKTNKVGFLAVNKWLLAATVVAVLASFSLYIWANYQDSSEKFSQNVKKVNLENSMLKEYITEARINNETFFGVVLPSWSGLTRERKEEILKKIVSIGSDKGFKNVHLLDKEGKTAASASKENLTVNNL
jgi:hypothetical protein